MLRDEEWERAKQAPWWLTALAVAIVVVAFFVGVYSTAPQNIIGWVVGIVTIAIYIGLGSARRRRARRRLREIHGQTPPEKLTRANHVDVRVKRSRSA